MKPRKRLDEALARGTRQTVRPVEVARNGDATLVPPWLVALQRQGLHTPPPRTIRTNDEGITNDSDTTKTTAGKRRISRTRSSYDRRGTTTT